MIVYAPISVGELIDKITILTIKLANIKDVNKKENIAKELIKLETIANDIHAPGELHVLYTKLLAINSDLWEIEEQKRQHEKEQRFDDEFIKLARKVYIKNDERASIKKQINLLVGSEIIEEKSY